MDEKQPEDVWSSTSVMRSHGSWCCQSSVLAAVGSFMQILARPFQSPSIIAEDICEGVVGTLHQMLSFAMASQT